MREKHKKNKLYDIIMKKAKIGSGPGAWESGEGYCSVWIISMDAHVVR